MLFPLLLPGLSSPRPTWDWAGVTNPPHGRAADQTATGNGRRSALARKRGEISGNRVVEQHLPFFKTFLESTALHMIVNFFYFPKQEFISLLIPKT